MQLVFKRSMNWTKIDAYQFRRNICLGFFLFFLQSAALKRVTEKQNEIILEKILVWEKLKMRYWNMSKGRNLNAQRSWKKTINGKKTRQEQRRIPDYELSNGLWVYHLYFLISLQKGNVNGKDGSVLSSVGSIVNTGGGVCGSD